MKRNIALNGLENVVSINKACSDKDGMADFFKHDKYSTLHSLKIDKGGEAKRVQICRLDTLLPQLEIDGVKLIKIDVEGAELDVIKGARKTIRRCGPDIIFEAWNDSYLAKISAELETRGYGITPIKAGCYLARRKP